VPLTAEDYFMLGQAGALNAWKKTELIDGVIIAMAPMDSLHGRIQRDLFLALHEACEALGGLEAAFEMSVKLGTYQVVQPDVMALTHLPPRGKIAAETLLLAIAVADTTLKTSTRRASMRAAACRNIGSPMRTAVSSTRCGRLRVGPIRSSGRWRSERLWRLRPSRA
jgi:hypothetical protein